MKISTGFLSGNLTANAGKGVRESATARLFAETLAAAIRERFPDAEVRVDWREGSGFLPPEFWTAVDCDPGHGEVPVADVQGPHILNSGCFSPCGFGNSGGCRSKNPPAAQGQAGGNPVPGLSLPLQALPPAFSLSGKEFYNFFNTNVYSKRLRSSCSIGDAP